MKARPLISLTTAVAAATAAVIAQDIHTMPKPGVKYSPYPDEDFPNQVFYGDTHLHTGYSTDAGMVGCTLGPEDAYRFARGESVISSHGLKARLQRPYDFLVVSDHSENLGLATAIAESSIAENRTRWTSNTGKGAISSSLWRMPVSKWRLLRRAAS
jgi:hypothetical protein